MKKRLLILGLVCTLLLPIYPTTAQDDGTPPPSPVAPPSDTNLPITALIFDADFSNADFWFTGASTTENADYALTDDGYSIISRTPESGLSFAPPLNLEIDNLYIEIGFTVNTCAIPESALLLFTRLGITIENTLNSMVYVVQCNGSFRARPMIESAIGPILINGTTLRLEEGQSYTMGVLMSERSVVWYLNQTEVAQFELSTDVPTTGLATPGVQAGLGYTLTSWRIWSLKNTAASVATPSAPPTPTTSSPSSNSNPLANGAIGVVLYRPTTDNPTSLPLGHSNPAAAYITGDAFSIYNNTPSAILPLVGLEGEDYYLELVFRIRACEDTSSIGLVWRANTDYSSYYAYQLSCAGDFRAILVQDGETTELVAGSVDPTPRSISSNLILSVYVKGDTAWLYLQTNLLASFTDDSLSQGGAGIILESGETGEKMDILAGSIVATETR